MTKEAQEIIDLQSERLLRPSTAELNGLAQRAAEKQQACGIQGAAADGFYARELFSFFKARISEVFMAVLAFSSVQPAGDMSQILGYLDRQILPFKEAIDKRARGIAKGRPFSREEPTIDSAYRNLRGKFAVDLAIAIGKQSSNSGTTIIVRDSQNFQIGSHNIQKSEGAL